MSVHLPFENPAEFGLGRAFLERRADQGSHFTRRLPSRGSRASVATFELGTHLWGEVASEAFRECKLAGAEIAHEQQAEARDP